MNTSPTTHVRKVEDADREDDGDDDDDDDDEGHKWTFYPGVDSGGGDLCRLPVVDRGLARRRGAVAINTLGFAKHTVHWPLKPTAFIHDDIPGSGIYIRTSGTPPPS